MTGTQPPRKPKVFNPDDPDVAVFTPDPGAASDDAGGSGGKPGAAEGQAETAREAGTGRGAGPGAFAGRDAGSGGASGGSGTVFVEDADTQAGASRGISWGRILVSALLSLAALAAGLWFTNFVSVALAREDWIGYLAMSLAVIAGVAAGVLALREIAGLWRLSRLSGLRRDAEAALRHDDLAEARAVTRRLKGLAGRARDKRWDLQRFREEERHMRSGTALLGLADRVLLAPADREARTIVYESARRVAIATAVIPITFLAVLFVLVENLRMTRRLAGAYGGRPGFLGGLRLFWWIITHLAATGAIAFTDDLFGQFLGQDVAHRVSRRLGEGAFNGAMTARLGVAAIALTRPLPFIEAQPPRIRSILLELFPEINPSDLIGGVLGRGRRGRDEAAADTEQANRR